MTNKVFKTTVTGVGPWCVEFPDGEILTMRTESRANLVANAHTVADLLAEAGSLLNAIRARDGTAYHNQRYNGGFQTEYMQEEQFESLVERIRTRLWMDVCEATPVNGLFCDVRYHDGTTGYADYDNSIGFFNCFPADKSETITHWKPAPREAV